MFKEGERVMNIEFDHLVHFIDRSPEDAKEVLRNFGLHAVNGGNHHIWGTHNSLYYSKTSYLEFLAVNDEAVAKRSTNPLISRLCNDITISEGLGQLCFRTNNLHQLRENLHGKGFGQTEIFNGERKTSNGDWIYWQMLFIIQHDALTLPLPFYIQWEQTDAERFKALKEHTIITNENESRAIQAIDFVVNDAANTANQWCLLFNDSYKIVKTKINAWNEQGMNIQVNEVNYRFFTAKNNDYLKQIIRTKGERPFAVSYDPKISAKPIEIYGAYYY